MQQAVAVEVVYLFQILSARYSSMLSSNASVAGVSTMQTVNMAARPDWRECDLDFNGFGLKAVFMEPVRLQDCDVQGKFDFGYAVFTGSVNFSRTTFRQHVSFSGARFEATVNLEGTRFEGGVDFTGAYLAAGPPRGEPWIG